MRPQHIHNLRHNEETRTPPVIGAFDTETRPVPGTNPEINVLRCWDLRGLVRNHGSYKDPVSAHTAGTTREGLAEAVDRLCAGQERVWLYAHNLAFDLPVSALLDRMVARGWTVIRLALDGPSPWVILGTRPRTETRHRDTKAARLHHEARHVTAAQCAKAKDQSCPGRKEETRYGCRLTIADSGSVWPRTKLATIGDALGIPKLPDPEPDDDPGWAERCAGDTQILLAALSVTLDWWDDQGGGNWGKTGATTGWNAMRHRMSGKPVVIDTGHQAVTLERAAIYGGRRSVFRFGELPRGRYSEADFERAYTVIARDCVMPLKRRGTLPGLPVDHNLITTDNLEFGLVAEVTISAGGGRWPCRDNGRIWYPQGRFTTVLAGPDIREAARLGVLESVGKCQFYDMGRAMRPWATWNLDSQADPGTPRVVQMALKHHGRAVIGKWGGHSYAHELHGPALSPGLHAVKFTFGPGKPSGWMVDLGESRWLSYPDGEGEDSFPAVLAYVESHVRVRIGRMVDALGTGGVIQCDTDGAVLNTGHLAFEDLPGLSGLPAPGRTGRVEAALAALSALCAPLTVREKHHGSTMRVSGPQHYSLGGMRKRSGIPADAEPAEDGTLQGYTWPNLIMQAQSGDPRGYVRKPGTWTEPACLASGWVIANGRVVPPESCIDANGSNCLLPYTMTVYHRAGLELGETQNPALVAAVRDPGRGASFYPWSNQEVQQIREEYT